MFNLLPRDTVFFDLFEGIARHIVDSATHLQRLTVEFPRIDGPTELIRKAEHASDDLAHQTLDRLDRTFITPFDREDIHTLVNEMDDIVDAVDALVKRIPLFHITNIPVPFARQAGVLMEATAALAKAVGMLRRTHKLADLSECLIEIHHQESIGDDNHHAAMSELFSGQTSALDVLKWKELYDYIENAIDGCEDVGNTLERIVLKNG